MSTRLYVGNLAYSTMEHSLRDAFAEYGEVVSATVIVDRMSGRSRGFGFVEFSNPQQAQAAVEALNGAMVDGRPIVVNVARERQAGGGGGGGGGGRGFGGGGGGGGGRGGGGGGRGGGRGGRGGRDRGGDDW
jgi:RNA recognition motif-containing protein